MMRLTQNMKQVNDSDKPNNKISAEEARRLHTQSNSAYDAGDYKKSFELDLKAAMAGNVAAMKGVGFLYRTGKGVEQNDAHAFSWYKKAAEAGDTDAMVWVGDFYLFGKGILENYDESFKWYQKAANLGHFYAMINLGLTYAHGLGVKRNPDKAVELVECDINKTKSDGNPENIKEAVGALLELARIFNNQYEEWKKAEIEIGPKVGYEFMEMYAYKLGMNYLHRKSLDCLKKASDLGNVEAQREFNRATDSSCFITTAVCDNFGKSDDCYELTTFRNFRDNWLINQSDGKSLIGKYYEIAPKIVSKINQLQNSNEIYKSIWSEYLKTCLTFIEDGKYQDCKNLYIKMVNSLQKSFLK